MAKRKQGAGRGLAVGAFALALVVCGWQGWQTVRAYQQRKLQAEYELALRHLGGDGMPVDAEQGLMLMRHAAEKGHVEAQMALSTMYEDGVGTEKDLAEALRWIREAVKSGDARAQNILGAHYYLGTGVEKDYAEAVRWYRLAVAQNDAEGKAWLGLCYQYGNGVEKNLPEAVRLWQEGAAQGQAHCQYYLGAVYETGNGLPKNEARAAELYLKSAEQGMQTAQVYLSRCYRDGRGVGKDAGQQVRWLQAALEQGVTNAEFLAGAQYDLAECYGSGSGVAQNVRESHRLYELAAEGGYAPAYFAVGWAYEYGRGDIPQDKRKAFEAYLKGAQAEDEACILRLARCYLLGFGVGRSAVQAKEWYRRSHAPKYADALYAEACDYMSGRKKAQGEYDVLDAMEAAALQSYPAALKAMGDFHREGSYGAEKDAELAMVWYLLAADQGDMDAKLMVAEGYRYGRGVTKDVSKAVKVYRDMALEGGDLMAKVHLGVIYNQGEGIMKDVLEGFVWQHLASDQIEKTNAESQAIGRPQIRTEIVEKFAAFVKEAPEDIVETVRERVREIKKRYPGCMGRLADGTPDPELRHLSSDVRLETGSVLVDRMPYADPERQGTLTLDNGLTEDAYVKVIQNQTLVAAFYVQGKTKFTFTRIPEGTYELLYCTGYGWDGKRRDFERGRRAVRYEQPLKYAVTYGTENGAAVMYTSVQTLTLHKMVGGNARTRDIPLGEFDRY